MASRAGFQVKTETNTPGPQYPLENVFMTDISLALKSIPLF